jgi:hypothetical protein
LIFAPEISAPPTAKETGMKIGPFILAVVLLGAAAIQASFAEDAASRAGHPAGSTPSAEPSGSPLSSGDAGGLVDKAKSDDHAPAENLAGPKPGGNAGAQEERNTTDKQNPKANVDGGPKGRGVKTGEGSHVVPKGVKSLDVHAGDAEAIDTRITVQSRRLQNTSDKARDVKSNFRISVPGNIHTRRLPASGTLNTGARNAIGLPVTRHESTQERSGESHGVPVQSAAHENPGLAASGADNLAKTDGGLERAAIERPSPSPIVSTPVAQRGAINGTGLVRPSSAPSGLGGPAKVIVGINATTIRPKHP